MPKLGARFAIADDDIKAFAAVLGIDAAKPPVTARGYFGGKEAGGRLTAERVYEAVRGLPVFRSTRNFTATKLMWSRLVMRTIFAGIS